MVGQAGMYSKEAIREVTVADVLHAPNSVELFRMYAEECSLPELGSIAPTDETYANLSRAGMTTLAAYDGERLVGFATLLTYVVPHYGKKIAATESIFIAEKYRARMWRSLRDAIEEFGKNNDCAAILYSAPTGSRFSRMLSLSSRYRHTNDVFLRNLQ